MSFLSDVKRSKAASMAAVSVLASTTRKFFWLSGGGVTCCRRITVRLSAAERDQGTHADAGQEEPCDGILLLRVAVSACFRSATRAPVRVACLVPYHGQELPVFIVGLRRHWGYGRRNAQQSIVSRQS